MKNLALFISLLVSVPVFGASALDGNWYRPCVDSEKHQIKVDSNSLTYSRIFHSDNDCEAPTYTMSWDASFVADFEPSPATIDFVLDGLWAKANTEADARHFDQIQFCDRTGWFEAWTKNEKLSVAGKICAGNQLAPVGFTAYNVFYLSDVWLQVDLQQSAPADHLRPTHPGDVFFMKMNHTP